MSQFPVTRGIEGVVAGLDVRTEYGRECTTTFSREAWFSLTFAQVIQATGRGGVDLSLQQRHGAYCCTIIGLKCI